jgi:DNA (cytosine-5)-methyltransferase 1
MEPLRSLDLFCGCGGSSIGARQAGVIPAGGIDIWPAAIRAFTHNIPNAIGYCNDIRDVDPRKLQDDLGNIDILLASPECIAHSIARGGKKYDTDELSKALAYEVIRFAKVLQPRWVVVENVVQMAKWDCFRDWCKELSGVGYNVSACKLNALHFGVPQRRVRLFVIGDRDNFPTDPTPSVRMRVTASDVIRDNGEDRWAWDFKPLFHESRSKSVTECAKHAIETLGHPDRFILVYYGSELKSLRGFHTLDKPFRTITTHDKFAIVRKGAHGYEIRMLQPPELAAAMGFPSDYSWPDGVSHADCVKMIGNAVCPPVMRQIIEHITKQHEKWHLTLDRPTNTLYNKRTTGTQHHWNKEYEHASHS